jgi:hypothetical protein
MSKVFRVVKLHDGKLALKTEGDDTERTFNGVPCGAYLMKGDTWEQISEQPDKLTEDRERSDKVVAWAFAMVSSLACAESI